MKAKQQVMDILQVTGYKCFFFKQKSFNPKEHILFIASILKSFWHVWNPCLASHANRVVFVEGLGDDCRLITQHFARVCYMDAQGCAYLPPWTSYDLKPWYSPCIDGNPAKPTEGDSHIFLYISNTLLGTNISSTPRHVWVEHFPFPKVGYVSSLEGSCICKARNQRWISDSSSMAIWIEIMQTKGYVHNLYIYIYISYVPISTGLERLSFINPKRCAALGWSWTMAWRTRRSGKLRLGVTTAGKCWSKRWEGITSQN